MGISGKYIDDLVSESIRLIKDFAKTFGDIPWIVGFSGGKDSTVVLHLMVRAVEEGASVSRVYVIYEDTLLEHPELRASALETLSSLYKYSLDRLNGFLEPVITKPAPGEDFVSMMVLKGYPAPGPRFRWCTDRLKLRPAKRFLSSLGGGRYVVVSGVRLNESFERKKNMIRNLNSFNNINNHKLMLTPILNWGLDDVVAFLSLNKRWDGKSYVSLLRLYGFDDEPLTQTPIGATRFGCWVCTVITKEKMPIPKILVEAKHQIHRISKDPRHRESVGCRLGKMNSMGKRLVAEVFLKTLKEYPKAFGYDTRKLEKCLETVINMSNDVNVCYEMY